MNVSKLAQIAILLAVCSLYIGRCQADSWQNTVTSSVSTDFDTNPVMSPTPGRGVWAAFFDPSYALNGRVGENQITTGIALQIARYSNKTRSPNRDSPTAFFNWLRPSEAGEFGINSRYAQVATRDSGGIDATGLVSTASTRASRTLSGSWKKEVTERDTLSVNSAYDRVSYKGGTYTNYSTRSGGLEYSYDLSERIKPFTRVSGNKYVPVAGGASSSLADATLGLNWKAEYLDGILQAGRSRVVGGNTDTQGLITVHYTGQQAQLTMNASRTVSPSGLGGFVKADLVNGGWTYALSDYSNTGIDLEWRKNFASSTAAAGTSTSSRVWIETRLTSLWSIRTYCQHRTTLGGGVAASTNIVGLSFNFSNSDS